MKRLGRRSLCRMVLALSTAGGLLVGCAPIPSGAPPTMVLPSQYGLSELEHAHFSPQHQQVVQWADEQLPQWWRQYGVVELDALVKEALKANSDIQATQLRLKGAQQQLQASDRSRWLPEVDVGIQAQRERSLLPELPMLPAELLQPTSLNNIFAGQAQVKYEVDLFGGKKYQVAKQANQLAAREAEFTTLQQSVVANVVALSLHISALAQQLYWHQKLLHSEQQQTQDMEQRWRFGSVPRSQVLTAQRAVQLREAQRAPIQAELIEHRHALALLLGRDPSQAPEPVPWEAWQWPKQLPLALPALLLERRPDIQLSQAELRAAAAEVGMAQAQMLPRIELSASYGQAGYNWSMLSSSVGTIWSLIGGLTQPLFHAGQLRAQKQAAVLKYEAQQEDYRAVVRAAFAEVGDVLAAIQAQSDAVVAYRQAETTSAEQYQLAQEQVRLGALAPADLRWPEQAWYGDQLQRLGAETQRFAESVRFFKAMGMPIQMDALK